MSDERDGLPADEGWEKLSLHRLRATCRSLPAQLEGRLTNGWYVYARSRHSHIYIGVDPNEDSAVGGDAIYSLQANQSNATHGCCTVAELEALTRSWVSTIDHNNDPAALEARSARFWATARFCLGDE